MLKSHVSDIIDEKVSEEKKTELFSLIDKAVMEFRSSEESEESAALLKKIQPFWEKFSEYQQDMNLSEEELDELIKILRSALPGFPEPEAE